MTKKINSSQISVVVQGAVSPEWTPKVLESIRKNLPDSKIILSTWEGTDLSGLDFDDAVINKDVGPNEFLNGKKTNLSRQIYSTIQGLRKVKTDYAIKIRSDTVIKNTGFLKYFDQYPQSNEAFKVFNKRIIVPSFYTVLGKNACRDFSDEETIYFYEVSDWFYFGLTEDLINLFDIPLPPAKHDHTINHPAANHEIYHHFKYNPGARYLDQQHIFAQCLLKNEKNICFKDWTDITDISRIYSRRFIVNNFIVLDYGKELNIENLKYFDSSKPDKAFVFDQWKKLYKKYCIAGKQQKIFFDFSCSVKKAYEKVMQFFKRKKIKLFSNIDTKDISVVVQGAIHPDFTCKTLKSIRKRLPESEIILSTWKGSDVTGLDCDILVLNEDPGACVFTTDGKKQNQNRQILSTQNGMQKATRKYVLKIRTDMKVIGTKFLKYFNKYPLRSETCKILKHRVLINSLYTRGTNTDKPFLFHPSDWMMFGLREDMLNIWDIPLAPEPETSQYFALHPELKHKGGCLTRWHAEQYIWVSFLKKNGIRFDFDNWDVFNESLRQLSDLSITNNCLLLEYQKQFDILCLKYRDSYGDSVTMHPVDWLENYNKFCGANAKIYYWLLFWQTAMQTKCSDKFRSHIKCLKDSFWAVFSFKWLKSLFSLPFYSFILFSETIKLMKRKRKKANIRR